MARNTILPTHRPVSHYYSALDPTAHFAPLRPVSRVWRTVAEVAGLLAVAGLVAGVVILLGAPS